MHASSNPPGDGYLQGIALFNRQEFFAAHEVLEDVWRASPAADRKFFQGLIQLAVAFHHFQHGNQAGAKSLLRRGIGNLDAYPALYRGLLLEPLRAAVAGWQDAFDTGASLPGFPRLLHEAASAGSATT